MNLKPIPQHIDPHLIRMDLGTQARKEIDEDTVRDYSEAMESGVTFPPCSVFFDVDTQEYILADGFHRLLAHLRAKPNDPMAIDQYLGSADDARWFSIGANKSHGLKRSNEDKRNAVELAFQHTKSENMSDRQIAAHVGVGYDLVSRTRKRLIGEGRLSESDSRIGMDGRTYNTANIGKTVENATSCSDCKHYKRNRCLLDGEDYASDNPACDEFEKPVTPVEDRDEGVDIVCKHDPNDPPEVEHRAARRHKGECVHVPLDKTNTDRAAVEIRMFLGENYLASLAQSALKILKED